MRLDVYAWVYPVSGAGFLSLAWRLRILAALQTQMPWLTSIRAVFAGYLGNAALPVRAGEVIKAAYIARQSALPFGTALGWIAVERVVDLCCLLLCALWIIPWVMGKSALGGGVYIFLALTACGVTCVVIATLRPMWMRAVMTLLLSTLGARISGWLRPKADNFLDGLSALAGGRRAGLLLLSTLLYWVSTLLTMQIWLAAFDLHTPWYGSVLLLAFLAFGTALPAAAAYIGTYHFAVVAALGVLGVAKERAAALAVFVHAAGIIPWALVAVILLSAAFKRGELPTHVPRG